MLLKRARLVKEEDEETGEAMQTEREEEESSLPNLFD